MKHGRMENTYEQQLLNFKKENKLNDRINFSSKIRNKGIGHVPVVIDSNDEEISELLGSNDDQIGRKWLIHGTSKEYHMDFCIHNVLQDVIHILYKKGREDILNYYKLSLQVKEHNCYENELLGDLYKKYRDTDDNILYIQVVKTVGVWGTLVYYKDYILQTIRIKK